MKTTIIVEETTRNSLKEIGKKGESYDQIIRNLLKTQSTINLITEGKSS